MYMHVHVHLHYVDTKVFKYNNNIIDWEGREIGITIDLKKEIDTNRGISENSLLSKVIVLIDPSLYGCSNPRDYIIIIL